MNTDDKLLKKIASGDEKAFNELFMKYGGLILGYCKKYLNQEQAEEVAQDVWMRVIRASKTYEPQGKALNWIYTIARNQCLGSLPKKDLELNEEIVGSEETLEKDLMATGEVREVFNKIEELPVTQKTCVMMFYVEEKTVEEISQTLRITQNLVKVSLFRARQKLKGEVI